jgi:hypothetical protein
LRDEARRVLRLVVRGNTREDKREVLLEIREELEELKVLLRFCHDAKAFPNFNYLGFPKSRQVDKLADQA